MEAGRCLQHATEGVLTLRAVQVQGLSFPVPAQAGAQLSCHPNLESPLPGRSSKGGEELLGVVRGLITGTLAPLQQRTQNRQPGESRALASLLGASGRVLVRASLACHGGSRCPLVAALSLLLLEAAGPSGCTG